MTNRIAELRKARRFTLEQLAERAGTSYQQVSRLEKGERRLTADWMVRLAQALDVEPADLLPPGPLESAGARPNGGAPTIVPPTPDSTGAPVPRPPQPGPDDLIPIRSAGRGGHGQEMFLEDGPIGYTRRPSSLMGVKDAYSIYMVGDSMFPRFEPGWLLHVNPHRPPRRGRAVVVTCRDCRVLVKLFAGWTGDELVLEQLNPPAEIRLSCGEVQDVHLVVGLDEEG